MFNTEQRLQESAVTVLTLAYSDSPVWLPVRGILSFYTIWFNFYYHLD